MKGNRVLLIKRSPKARFFPGKWEFPGGKAEYKEHPDKAIIRETKEEIGLSVKVIRPINITHFMSAGEHVVQINYLTKAKPGKVVLSHEHKDYEWVPKSRLKKVNTFEDVREAVKLVSGR